MQRREFLRAAGILPLVATPIAGAAPAASFRRVRPSDPAWPSQARWEALDADVVGNLIRVESPLVACAAAPGSAGCPELFKALKNPYYIGDHVALTQTTGWMDAWVTEPSVYAVAAQRTADVVAAVNFARDNDLRLVVKGGGHSYFGASNAADSLLIWTRPMQQVTLHDSFVPSACPSSTAAQAVTVDPGAIWMRTYNAVSTGGGRYVQGGGCATVGVAGLVQGGGFGSFSKQFGTGAGGLLEAEVVTADGAVRVANACTNPDLFWAIKGAGNGFGVITRLTLRTHDLPAWMGVASLTVRASSDDAFRRLIAGFIGFYAQSLFNPAWGEQAAFLPGNELGIFMVFQGLDRQQAERAWRPFLDFVAASPRDFSFTAWPRFMAIAGRHFWDPAALRLPSGDVLLDDRPGASKDNVFYSGNYHEAGFFLDNYESAWMPAGLLSPAQQPQLADALFAASRHWRTTLHFNKGLAGGTAEAIAAARDTCMNPGVLDAFALAISANGGLPAWPGIAGHEPDLQGGRARAMQVRQAIAELRKVAPNAGCYVSEAGYFDENWQEKYWGANYPRLLAIKQKYDPDGLFFVHHGVGSEGWSTDGFVRSG
ncbi:MAG: FAD-binding oxidoreductase [Acetobacteraceae bacterium]